MSSTSTSTGISVRCIGRRWRGVLAFFLGLILGTAMAWADGKAYPPVAVSTEVTMPDQRALLVWSNGVERLAIETRIVGEGTDFAWVVPLSSAPKVEAATVGRNGVLVLGPGFIGRCHLLFPDAGRTGAPGVGFSMVNRLPQGGGRVQRGGVGVQGGGPAASG